MYSQENNKQAVEKTKETDSIDQSIPSEVKPIEENNIETDAPVGTVDEKAANSENKVQDTLVEPIESPQNETQNESPNESIKKLTPLIKSQANKNTLAIQEQLHWTPEDPSFLYETRYIPGHSQKEEFLSKELEQEVIEERIQEEKDFRESLKKINIKLPDPVQISVVMLIIVLFVIYRVRVVGSRRKKGGRFK
jgi:hypothetical protein